MKIPRARAVVRAAVIACASSSVHAAPAARVAADHLADLTLEQLADVEVTSVTGRPERANDAAASIYVITGEDIRRSAATSLPEALRLAPNLQVARLNAGQYAITARGFNTAIGNKLLVLVDGRTVYSPLFPASSGTRSTCGCRTSSGSRSSAAPAARSGARTRSTA
jgi:iron complex outermembrane receptor protein